MSLNQLAFESLIPILDPFQVVDGESTSRISEVNGVCNRVHADQACGLRGCGWMNSRGQGG